MSLCQRYVDVNLNMKQQTSWESAGTNGRDGISVCLRMHHVTTYPQPAARSPTPLGVYSDKLY